MALSFTCWKRLSFRYACVVGKGRLEGEALRHPGWAENWPASLTPRESVIWPVQVDREREASES